MAAAMNVEAARERIAWVLHPLRAAEYEPIADLEVDSWDLPGEPIPIEDALREADFTPAAIGLEWGVPWATTWFRFRHPGTSVADTAVCLIDIGFQ